MLIKKVNMLVCKISIPFLFVLILISFMIIPTNFIKAASENQYKGIDVSNWQGSIDVSKIKNAGYSFVISKITEGSTYIDKYGKQDIDNTKENGLIAGAYHFARFQNKEEAIEEANFFKQNCPSNVDFVVLDFEQQCDGDMTDACLAFLDSVSTIAPAVIYCNPSHINEHLNSNITKYPLWIANYGVSTPSTPKWGTYAIWQYSENGQVDGVDGAVDLDITGPAFDTIFKHQPGNDDGKLESKIDLEINDGQTYYSGNIDVKGWTLNSSGAASVKLFVDGGYKTTVNCNLPTPDLAGKYPQYPNAADSGYEYKLSLSNGHHKIRVSYVDNKGNEVSKEVNINVDENTDPNVPIKTIDPKSNVDTNKIWTIKFNSKLDEKTVNSKTIQVYDSEGNAVNVGITYKIDSNEVVISPPSSGYESGKNYTIKITNGVKNIDGKALSAVTIMNFTIKTLSNPNPQPDPSKASYTITIDPGHGGYDSGAVGQNGTLEKNITLDIGLKAGEILKQHNINVVYTRTSDQISWPSSEGEDLQARCDISNNANSNAFVSIHINSFDSNNAYGTETYYYPTSLKGQALANFIQTQLVNDLGTYNRGVKTGNYYVLKDTQAPAVITEIAFISNSKEEKDLNDSSFRNKAAQAIADGILKYLGME